MLYKTEGIVLNYIKYRESSIITRIYTRHFGLKSYIVNSVRSKNARSRIAFFQPLTLVDLVVYNKPGKEINRISEIKCFSPYRNLPYDSKKSAIALFITEVLSKTLKEETSNQELFDFICSGLMFLDETQNEFENFHLTFLLRLSAFLGFYPSSSDDIISRYRSDARVSLSIEEREFMDKIREAEIYDFYPVSNQIRRKALDCILGFYASHVEQFGEVNSVKVLKEILER